MKYFILFLIVFIFVSCKQADHDDVIARRNAQWRGQRHTPPYHMIYSLPARRDTSSVVAISNIDTTLMKEEKQRYLHNVLFDDAPISATTLLERRDRYFYEILLRIWKSDSNTIYRSHQTLRANTTLSGRNKNIDSTEAMRIAITAMRRHFGSTVLPITARLVGNDKEHWLVYCYTEDKEVDYASTRCYEMRFNEFVKGHTPIHLITRGAPCPPVIRVLVSRESGQVLSMDSRIHMFNSYGYDFGLLKFADF